MRISLADSSARGFNKWCETHDSGRKDERDAGAGDIATSDQNTDHAVMTPPERPHRPWFVPGVGTL
jgi:hypothetical protein